MRSVALLAAASAVLAGCVAPAASLEPATVALLVVDGAPVPAGGAFAWEGRELEGAGREVGDLVEVGTCLALADCPTATAPCTERNCERREVVVANGAPAGSRLVVGLRWPSPPGVRLALTVEDADGTVVAVGRSIVVDQNGAVAVVEDATPGRYVVVVAAARGTSDYEAAVRLAPPPPLAEEPRDLLPDLVTLPPTDLTLHDPPGQYFGMLLLLPTNDAAHALGAEGCALDEAGSGARRCLRFSNAIGNVGEGSLDVVLRPVEGAKAVGPGGRFVQLVQRVDGSVREVEAGAAEFHHAHGHWHNGGSNAFTVHAFDPATGAQGEALREGRKIGMCLADVGVVDVAFPGLEVPDHQGVGCINPASEREWRMGLSRGWYDNYPWVLTDQYVDVAGLEDGTYRLCSRANAHGFLAESDVTNNEACTAFRLEGDEVVTLDPLPYHADPP